MKQVIPILSTSAALLASAVVAFAAPFNPKDVAADPAFVMHVDCDALHASAIGQWLLSQPSTQDKLASMGKRFDFDLRKQLHGITIYTPAAHSEDRVSVFEADFDADQLLAKAQDINGFYGTTNGSHVIYSWLDSKWQGKGGGMTRFYGAVSSNRIVIGQTESRLADAVDVVEGTARSFEGAAQLPRAKSGETILFEAALIKVDFRRAEGMAAMLQMCKTANLKVCEAGNTTTAALRLETGDDQSATQVNTMLQGLLGMLKMQEGNPKAMKLANAITLTKDGFAVAVNISMLSSELIDMMKQGQ